MPLTYEEALQHIQITLNEMHSGGALSEEIEITPDMLLVGNGSPLDSIGFVTFLIDLETRLETTTGNTVSLALSEIEGESQNSGSVSCGMLAQHIVRSIGP